jgi:hypothetical protein
MRPTAVAVALVAVLGASSCGVHGLSFVQDKRVDIVHPHDRTKTRLPVTIDWTVKNFAIGPDAGSFGVFVDRSPQRAGKTLSYPFRGNSSCKGIDGRRLCDTADFLAEQGVFRTTDTNFTLSRVNHLTGNERKRQFHEVTVVLLDAAGKRVGEGAWSVQLEVRATV